MESPCKTCAFALPGGWPDKEKKKCAACKQRTKYLKATGHDVSQKWCSLCKKYEDIEDFARDKSRPDGRNCACKISKNASRRRLAASRPKTEPDKRKFGNSIYEKLPSEMGIPAGLTADGFLNQLAPGGFLNQLAPGGMRVMKDVGDNTIYTPHVPEKVFFIPEPIEEGDDDGIKLIESPIGFDRVGFGGFSLDDKEAEKIKAVLLKLHDFLIGG